MAHDRKRTGVWNARTGVGPGRHGWRLMEARREEAIAVLLVDDHEIVRRGLRAFLESEPDIEVVGEAAGGAQALDLLASMASDGRPADAVVMDLQMAPVSA